MKNLAAYLSDVYGEQISVKKFEEYEQIPFFLRDSYDFYEGYISGSRCLFLFAKDEKLLVWQILKNFLVVNKYVKEIIPVLVVNFLDNRQRTALIKKRIPFIVLHKQIFLPFISMLLSEDKKIKSKLPEVFAPSVQVVYLYLFYFGYLRENTVNDIAKYINYSAMTISRAFKVLRDLGLVEVIGAGTKKKFTPINRTAYWEKGRPYLVSPVVRVVYALQLAKTCKLCVAGLSAMSISGDIFEGDCRTYAVGKRVYDSLALKNSLVAAEEWEKPKIKLELWSYAPELFAHEGVADLISVYSSLASDEPRVEKVFEKLMRGYVE